MTGRSWERAVAIVLALLVAGAVGLLTSWDLGGTPPGLYIDEVATALTARALWETGADLDGNHLPLYPRTFRDKERPMPMNPVYTYSVIPFALAGPGGWSARLPSVLWIWIAAAGIGLCVRELTGSPSLGFALGAGAALTPWLFVPGRVGSEAISLPAVTALAFWSLLRGTRTGRARVIIVSAALFGLSIYCYTTARLLVPLTLAAMALIWLRDERVGKAVAGGILLSALMAAPLALYLRDHPGSLTWRVESTIWADSPGPATVIARFAANYLRYLSPRFLLFEGDANPRHGTGRGMLLWIAAPLILAGLWEAWRRRGERTVRMVVAGLAIAPVAAALTTDGQPHALRSITSVVFWAALAGMGCRRLLDTVPRPRIAAVVIALLAGVNVALFAGDYFGRFGDRAFWAFDGGKGVILKEAFARRMNRPLVVPAPLLTDVRQEVFVPYWGAFPIAEWLRNGPASFGVRPSGAGPPEEGLIVQSWYHEQPDGTLTNVRRTSDPPAGARSIFSVGRGGVKTYELFEK